MTDNRTIAVLSFVAVFAAIVAAGAILGVVVDDTPSSSAEAVPDHVEVENPQYDVDRVTSDRDPGNATIEMDSPAFDNEVVVHVGGGMSERHISPIVNALVDGGHQVTVVADSQQQMMTGSALFSDPAVSQMGPPPEQGEEEEAKLSGQLDEAHGLLSIGVSSYTEADLEEIGEFIEEDGRVVMALDPDQEFSFGEGHSEMYSELGLYTEPGYVYNLAENDLNYQRIFVEPDGGSMLTDGVERVVFPGATPVQGEMVDETLRPIAGSELSTTREETDNPVLARNGDLALIGDTGFMSPENTQRADNDALVGNIAEFLVESDRDVEENDSSGETSTGSGEANETKTVTVAVGPDGENRFEPEIIEIEPGDTVVFEWKSDGYNIVPVYQDPEDADWEGVEEVQEEGFVHEHTFEEEGVHEFISEPHEEDMMGGVIVVGNPEGFENDS